MLDQFNIARGLLSAARQVKKQPAFSTIVSNVSLLSKFQVLFCQDVQSWIELANKINGVNF